MKGIFVHLKQYKKECILGPLFKLLEAGFDLLVPLVTATIIDRGIAANDKQFILQYGGVLLLLAAVGLTCSLTAQYFAAKAAVGFAAKLRYLLFEHIQTLSFTDMDKIGSSTLITRMTSDINQVQSGVNMVLRLFLRSPFIVFGAMFFALAIDVKAALTFVVVILLLALVVFGIMLISMPLYKKVQESLDRVLMSTKQNLTGVRVIRAFCKEKKEETEFQENNESLAKRQLFVGRISALTNPVTYVMINIALVVLLWAGGKQVQVGTLTQGQVVALINYLSQILVELIKMANTIVLTNKALACARRIQDVLDVTPVISNEEWKEEANIEKWSGGGCKVEFSHVSMTYDGALEPSVEDISFVAEPGEFVGIIGGTGSGKTSLVHLIPRFYDTSAGSVKIDGKDVREIPLQTLRKNIGIVMQKPVLFHGTIRENLLWGNENATEEEIMEALELSQSLEFVMQKEKTLDYIIEQGGKNLSGGQRQRLTIARALLGKPGILIFDDSTSALDYATDYRLRKALSHLAYHPTIFMISQRTSSICHANQILVLDDGKMMGKGTHETLRKDCEVYEEIHSVQNA